MKKTGERAESGQETTIRDIECFDLFSGYVYEKNGFESIFSATKRWRAMRMNDPTFLIGHVSLECGPRVVIGGEDGI